MKRTGPLRDRLKVRALRLSVVAWRIGVQLGLPVPGSTEGPTVAPDAQRDEAFERLITAARAGNGTIDTGACTYPVHEFLSYLVLEHGLLLHGSNHCELELLEPRPARDFETELLAVVACADGIWPLFYAVVARDRVDYVFTACLHVGKRCFYMFGVGGDPSASWTDGAVYALPRAGFRREWGEEWVSANAVRPVLRVPVSAVDFPLRHAVRLLGS